MGDRETERIFAKLDELAVGVAGMSANMQTLVKSHDELKVEVVRMFREGCSKRDEHERITCDVIRRVEALEERPTKALGVFATIMGVIGTISGLFAAWKLK